MYCRKCGRQIEDDSLYCRYCGANIGSIPSTTTATATAPSTASAPVPELPRSDVLKSNVETFDIEQAGRLVYAGFWRRFGAAIVDWIVISILFLIVGVVIGIVGTAFPSGTAENFVDEWGGLLAILIALLYYPTQESSSAQATLGKRLFNLVVTDTQQRPISFWRALGRYAAKILSGMTLGIGYLMAGFTVRKQALHDMLADTLVLVRG